jgi:hypothetical protein
MPKIKRYQNRGKLPPNHLHPLTELREGDELLIDGNCYDVSGQNVKDMNIIYLPEVEQGENALLCCDGVFYAYDPVSGEWVLWEGDEKGE